MCLTDGVHFFVGTLRLRRRLTQALGSMTKDLSTVDVLLRQLIDSWCDRRALRPLRVILQCYPLVSGLTDEWASLATGLKAVRVQFAADLVAEELDQVIELQHLAESVVYR